MPDFPLFLSKNLRQCPKRFRRVDGTGRIVRRVQNQQLGSYRDFSLQIRKISLKIFPLTIHFDLLRIAVSYKTRVSRIVRFQYHDLIVRIQYGAEENIHCPRSAVAHDDVFRRKRQPPLFFPPVTPLLFPFLPLFLPVFPAFLSRSVIVSSFQKKLSLSESLIQILGNRLPHFPKSGILHITMKRKGIFLRNLPHSAANLLRRGRRRISDTQVIDLIRPV